MYADLMLMNFSTCLTSPLLDVGDRARATFQQDASPSPSPPSVEQFNSIHRINHRANTLTEVIEARRAMLKRMGDSRMSEVYVDPTPSLLPTAQAQQVQSSTHLRRQVAKLRKFEDRVLAQHSLIRHMRDTPPTRVRSSPPSDDPLSECRPCFRDVHKCWSSQICLQPRFQ